MGEPFRSTLFANIATLTLAIDRHVQSCQKKRNDPQMPGGKELCGRELRMG